MSIQDTIQQKFNELAEIIEEHLKKNANYHFRPMQIDDINIYMVLHGKYKILNVESIYIGCKVKIDGENVKQNYSLYHYKYDTIKQALQKAKEIKEEYRIYDGELVSARSFKMLKLEEQIIPYSEDECCVVCYENTSDITECKHPICLGCREKCILQEQPDCPVCRSSNIMSFYTNRSGLINNDVYGSLKRAINSDNKKWTSDNEDSDDESDDGDSDDGDSDNHSIQSLNDALVYYGIRDREREEIAIREGEEIARREQQGEGEQGEGEHGEGEGEEEQQVVVEEREVEDLGYRRRYHIIVQQMDIETRIRAFNAIMTEDDEEHDEISEFLGNM